jgi:predicted dehydrogenase
MYTAAVIGLGNIGLMYDFDPKRERPSSHALAYDMNDRFHRVVGHDLQKKREESLVQLIPNSGFYEDVREMLISEAPEVVSICTPPEQHLSNIEEVLEHSDPKVIFLEKPVAQSHELNRLIEVSRQSKTVFIPNLSRRWNTGIQDLTSTIRNRKYGDLITLNARYTRGIRNTGSHLLDLINLFAGRIDKVHTTRLVSTSSENEGDPSYSFFFNTEKLIHGHVDAFDDRNFYMFEIDLFFERGKVEIRLSGDQIIYYQVAQHPLFSGFLSLKVEKQCEHLLKESNLQNAIQHIVNVIDKTESPIVSLEEGVAPLLIGIAIEKSFVSGVEEPINY